MVQFILLDSQVGMFISCAKHIINHALFSHYFFHKISSLSDFTIHTTIYMNINNLADGKYCITGSNDRTVRLWNPTRIDPAYRPPPSASRTNTSSSSFISSQEYYGGRRVDNGRLDSKQLQNQHLPSALPMQTYTDGNTHPIHCIDTNSSSTILLSASDKTLFATDLVTAQCKQKWWGHVARIDYVTCLGGAPNNNQQSSNVGEEIYASASYDSTVRLWDARSRSKDPLMILNEAKDAVTCVAQGKDGGGAQIVTSSVDGKVCYNVVLI